MFLFCSVFVGFGRQGNGGGPVAFLFSLMNLSAVCYQQGNGGGPVAFLFSLMNLSAVCYTRLIT